MRAESGFGKKNEAVFEKMQNFDLGHVKRHQKSGRNIQIISNLMASEPLLNASVVYFISHQKFNLIMIEVKDLIRVVTNFNE